MPASRYAGPSSSAKNRAMPIPALYEPGPLADLSLAIVDLRRRLDNLGADDRIQAKREWTLGKVASPNCCK